MSLTDPKTSFDYKLLNARYLAANRHSLMAEHPRYHGTWNGTVSIDALMTISFR